MATKKNSTQNTAIIGIDFGNINSFPAFIMDMDVETRRGGTELSLLPAEASYIAGIPTTYHIVKRRDGTLTETYGLAAQSANPAANRRNLLKRRFQKSETIEGKLVHYDEVITRMIEHIVRIANRTMKQNYQMTTNQIALAYPVEFTHAELKHLVTLAEKATLEDGKTKVKVAGTIREPAAAALAYLGSIKTPKQDYNVLVFDLGGGTFDIASVTTHLQGRVSSNHVEYYDVIAQDGKQLGGKEFDDAMLKLFITKSGYTPKGNRLEQWRIAAEAAKIQLSSNPVAYPELYDADDNYLDISITVEEYERAIRDLVKQTVDMTVALLKNPNVPTPDMILLTGGQSQTPLIRKMLLEALPDFKAKGKCDIYKPQQAISFGAARFGVLELRDVKDEDDRDETNSKTETKAPPVKRSVIRRNRFDLGLRNVRDEKGVLHVDTLIKAGTDLPTGSENTWRSYRLTSARRTDRSVVVEAVKLNPDPYKQDTDYRQTMQVVFDFGRVVPEGKQVEFCLYIDKDDIVRALVRDPETGKISRADPQPLTNFQ